MSTGSIALIAHDSRKDELVLLAKSQQSRLSRFNLVATKGTGQLVKARTGLNVTLLAEGPRGGDQQVAALVASGEIRAVIFLRDPLKAQSFEPDILGLLRVCDVHNVPIATNPATAKAVLNLIFANANVPDSPTKTTAVPSEVSITPRSG